MMERFLEEFVRRRRELKRRGEVGRGRQYPEEMVSLAVRYAEAACGGGVSERKVAARLGISLATLRRWRDRPMPRVAGLHEVVVAPETKPITDHEVALVTPDGFRIEGIRAGSVVGLVEALRR